ncbi:MAG: conjugal transfer protein TraX [Lachnospiraceae bacterium]|nr:conjugal transfer protein TraX [Lachnospiraceae bacterium]
MSDVIPVRDKGIPGSTLKIIAIITMLIDHIGAAILEPYLVKMGAEDLMMLRSFDYPTPILIVGITDFVLRLIGRIAFPIFCFLLIEGFYHTKSRLKYALRLFVFALIAEVPFDLAFNSEILEFAHQNVFLTLLLGLLSIWAYEAFHDRFPDVNKWYKAFGDILIIFVAILISILIKNDYTISGVTAIYLMNVYRQRKKSFVWEQGAGCVFLTLWNLMEVTSLLTIPLVKKYNGQKGLNLKYVFYAFYPVHLLILYAISYFLVGR